MERSSKTNWVLWALAGVLLAMGGLLNIYPGLPVALTVPVGEFAAARLRDLRAPSGRHSAFPGGNPVFGSLGDRLGETWQDLDLVCDRWDGGPIDPDLVTKNFKRFAAKAGLDPKTTLHDLRHAALTEMGRAGVHPLIVSTLAGHSDPAFTMRTYQHAWDEGADEGAAVVADAYKLS